MIGHEVRAMEVDERVAPLRNVRLLVLSLLANFVLMPLAAIALAKLLQLDEPLGVGLLLLGAAAGAPAASTFCPALSCNFSKADSRSTAFS